MYIKYVRKIFIIKWFQHTMFCFFTTGTALKGKNLLFLSTFFPLRLAPILEPILGIISRFFLDARKTYTVLATSLLVPSFVLCKLHLLSDLEEKHH